MSPEEKRQRIAELAAMRKEHVPPGYRCISMFKGGRYDSDIYVVPWTKSAHNENADVMLIAQDWASESLLDGKIDEDMARLGHKAALPTNKNLFKLLRQYLELQFSDTYATDLFPFVKAGGMSAYIPFQTLVTAAKEFGLPQIQIIRPKMVICLGIGTFGALWVAHSEYEGRREKRLTWAHYDQRFSSRPLALNAGDTEVYAVTHLGAWSSVRKHEIGREWHFLGARLAELRKTH